jgi:hypothetical protein
MESGEEAERTRKMGELIDLLPFSRCCGGCFGGSAEAQQAPRDGGWMA